MELNRNIVDVSSFFLVEATGDSEADLGDAVAVGDVDGAAEDDAQSCSCDTGDVICDQEVNDDDDDRGSSDGEEEEEEKEGDDFGRRDRNWTWHEMGSPDSGTNSVTGEEEEKEGDDFGRKGRRRRKVMISVGEIGTGLGMKWGRRNQESSVSVGVGRSDHREVMNEVEMNRHFWETCLAVGYP